MGSGFTFSTWINTTSTTSSTLFGQETSGGVILYIKINTQVSTAADAGKVMAWYRDGSSVQLRAGFTSDNNAWRDGAWAHLVVTIDPLNDNITFHIDGVKELETYAANNTPSDFDAFGHNLFLGALNNVGSPGAFIDGRLDEVGIWNRVLSTSEILDLYNNGTGMTYTDDFGLWNITFNLTDSSTGLQIDLGNPNDDYALSCNNGFNVSEIDDNPYTATNFAGGDVECTFSDLSGDGRIYFDKTLNITADSNKTIEIEMSSSNSLTQEEHDWLEAIHNCMINGVGCASWTLN